MVEATTLDPASPPGSHPGMVSVVIPDYNHARYIADAIRSVLGQDYQNYEIIVVDDGSTDNSREVVAQFGERVRYIYQENRGLSAARNTGIKAARGDYIGVLDADDMYQPSFMSRLVGLLEDDPEAEAAYCGYRFVDDAKFPLYQIEARNVASERLFRVLAEGNFLVPESMLVRRRCYQAVGEFDESLRAVEDLDMWLRITRRYKVIGTTDILTHHRVLSGSMSTDPKRQTVNRLMVIGKHFGPEPGRGEPSSDCVRRVYGRAYLASTVEYLQAKEVEGAAENFSKMAVICPQLLGELETFYELSLGDQPKGSRGDFSTLDIGRNASVALGILSQLFNKPEAEYQRYRNAAYGNTYLALGLLSYGAKDYNGTRKYLLQAALSDNRFAFNRRLVVTFLKSLLGVKGLALVKSLRA